MRIKQINFNNYRPFLDAKIKFKEHNNITLMVGDNGAGKSEILLSVLWCFYGEDVFKFAELSGKENNPHSLRDEIYRSLQESKIHKAEAVVEIKFEDNGRNYTLERKEIFTKGAQIIKHYELRLSEKKDGVVTLPIKNETLIKIRLNEIMPKKIAKALFFDGEKMAKLTSSKNKKDEVLGIIEEVTDVSTLKRLKSRLEDLKKDPNKRMKSNAKSENVNTLIRTRDKLDTNIVLKKIELDNAVDIYKDAVKNINDILSKIDKIRENSTKKETLNRYESNIKIEKNKADEINKQLNDEISQSGYLFFLDEIISDINQFVKEVNIPIGIDSKSVNMILKGNFNNGSCICGREITDEVQHFLNELKGKLPPEFKPAEITTQIHYINENKKEVLKSIMNYNIKLSNVSKNITGYEEKIKVLKDEIFEITKEDRSIQSEFARFDKLKKDNARLKQKYDLEYKSMLDNLKSLNKQINSLKNMTAEYEKAKLEYKVYSDYIKFIDHLQAIEKKKSIDDLNIFFKKAFGNISADEEEKFEVEIDNNYEIIKYVNVHGKKVKKNSSTGQMKVMAMAFVKAITDFATQIAKDDLFKEKKKFPVLIDAAFGDVSGENLNGVSNQLKEFDTQLIVLVAKDQLETFKGNIKDHIGQEFIILRNKTKGLSTIEEVSV